MGVVDPSFLLRAARASANLSSGSWGFREPREWIYTYSIYTTYSMLCIIYYILHSIYCIHYMPDTIHYIINALSKFQCCILLVCMLNVFGFTALRLQAEKHLLSETCAPNPQTPKTPVSKSLQDENPTLHSLNFSSKLRSPLQLYHPRHPWSVL